MNEPEPQNDILKALRKRLARYRRAREEGEPPLASQLGQIGVLGWIIVTPTLAGLFAGRWLDHRFDSGVFWSASLLMLGVALGCWSAWRWMRLP